MEDLPFSELMFALKYNICRELPAFTPWDLEKTAYEKVMKLYGNLIQMKIRENSERGGRDKVIRRPASNDWF